MNRSPRTRHVGRHRLGVVSIGVAVMLLAVLAAPGGSAFAATPPTRGWMLGLGFESLSGGVASDASPSGLTAALRGDTAPTLAPSRTGHGQALSLHSAQQQFAEIPDATALDVNHFTIAAWVRYLPNVHDDRWEVMEKAGAYWINIRTDTRKLRLGGFFGSCVGHAGTTWRYVDSATAIAPRTWVHVAGSYNGSMLRIYLNGTLDASLAVTGDTCVNEQPLAIGAKDNTTAAAPEAYFDGRLDDVVIYARALSASQVRTLRASVVP
jgi:hypothetical protein